jgi:hypothetical protein
LDAEVGGVEADEFPERASGDVDDVDGVVAGLRSAAVQGMARTGQGIVSCDVVVELIVVAPDPKPGNPELLDVGEAVVEELGAAAVGIVVPGVAGECQDIRGTVVDHPFDVGDGLIVRTGAEPGAVVEEMDIGELEDADAFRVGDGDAGDRLGMVLGRG